MKKQINPTLKAHLIRGAFYLILLLAVCAIPFALAERNTAKRSVLKPLAALSPVSTYGRQTQPSAAHADNVLNHFKGGKQTQPASVFRTQQPLGLDCDNAPGIVIHDDGTIEDGYSGNPAAGVTEVRVVDKFTPTSYPNSYTSVCLDFVTLAGGPPTYNVDIVVYDDDGAGGSPGTLLGSLNAQSATTHVFSPGQTPIWNSYNISGLGINITSGSVYIGARWMPPSPTNVYMSADESTTHPVGFAGGYFWDNIDNAWATTQSFFPAYRACMIRAVQSAAGTPSPTPSPTCGGPAAWQPGPDQSPARYALQAALGTDNMLYIAGGLNADNMTNYDQVSRYDYTTNTWSNVASLPVPLSQGTMGALNGKIYVAGGFIGGTSVSDALYIYDIATNTWTSGANMPTSPGVEAAAGAVVNGKFYVMGGDDFNNGLNTNFIYDIATNTWTTGATLPDNRTNTYATAYNGLIYVYGGLDISTFTAVDALLLYDPVANSWTNLGSAGTGGFGNYGGISPFGTDQLLITDGADGSFNPTSATHIFTISSGTFSAGPAMLGNRAAHAQGTLPDGRVLVADGLNTSTTTVSTVELLTTPPPCASPTPTATATATATPTATVEPRTTPTPRPRPTPAPRP